MDMASGITHMLDANPQVAQQWAREMLCAKMAQQALPHEENERRAAAAAMLNRNIPDLEDVRKGYLQVHKKARELLIWRKQALSTSAGCRMRSIADTLDRDYVCIYLDHDKIDVFLCTDGYVATLQGR